MKRQSVLVFSLMFVVLTVQVQRTRADLYTYMIGDDDGFGSGSPVTTGDTINGFGPMDADGTDGLVVPAWDQQYYTFTFDSFSSIAASSLFVQYADWPENSRGVLRIDGHDTSYTFPQVSPWQQQAPWTVLGATVDLMLYVNYLYDGIVVFEFVDGTDAYSIDYLRLSIDDGVVPVPLPGAVLLGAIGLCYSSWRLRRKTSWGLFIRCAERNTGNQSLATGACVIISAMFMGSVGRADLSDGLVAYYPFNGTANDASENGHDGVVNGASLSIDRFGEADSAYSFDGTDDYISVPYSPAFNSATFTLSAWVRPIRDLAPGAGTSIIVARGEDFDSDHAWAGLWVLGEDSVWGSGATLLYEDSGDVERAYYSGVFPQPDLWTHIAATRSVNGTVSVYHNGVMVGGWNDTPAPAVSYQDLTIGATWGNPSGSVPYLVKNFFPGLIDDVYLYNRALAADEVRELAVVPIPGAALLGAIGLAYSGWRLRRRTA